MTRAPLSAEAIRFRDHVIDALWGQDRFYYIDSSHFVGVCPLCDFAVGVRFHGRAPRATLTCHGGCAEGEIAEAIGLRVRA